MKKLPFPPSTAKLDRKSGRAGQALQLGVAWNLRFGGTHMFGGKSAELRTNNPEFWMGSHPVVGLQSTLCALVFFLCKTIQAISPLILTR